MNDTKETSKFEVYFVFFRLIKIKQINFFPWQKTQPDNERAYLGEVRTVIVGGLSPETSNQAVEMFFENRRRSGGGRIEKLERCQPGVAHITFASAEGQSLIIYAC